MDSGDTSDPRTGMSIRVGVYGVIRRGGDVLLTRTQSGSRRILNFPGGALDAGESPVDGLLREIREELGTSAEVFEILHVTRSLQSNPEFPDSQLVNLYFRVEIDHASFESGGNGADVLGAEWRPLDALPFDEMLDVDREAVLALRAP